MNAAVINVVRKGLYLDSVALMRMSRSIAMLPGVVEAALMMGSPANKEIMADAGLLAAAGEGATGGDLVIAVRAASEAAAQAAVAEVEALLERPARAGVVAAEWRPRTLRAALRALPEAKLALISVPGEFAAAEARKALRRGLHAMIFSDNVSLADERALKLEARERGRLVMGPDCGTAILNGVPLAFANRVPRGAIAVVGASGTGMQEIACLIARGGKGISQAIGVGGRDLHREVGALSTLTAIDMLDRDPDTRHVVLVSKPPAPEVAAAVLARVGESEKPFTVCFVGAPEMAVPGNAVLAGTLEAAAEHALGHAVEGIVALPKTRRPPGRRAVRGLFAGGTLCAEAQAVFAAAGETPASNAPIPGLAPADGTASVRHLLLDLGADEYTRGRPHPMLDPGVRAAPLREALADADVAAVLLDVVIGQGAHPDPAGEIARLLAGAEGERPIVVASVTGTDQDFQVRAAQVATLAAAGVIVAPSNAAAARLVLEYLGRGG